MSLKGSLETVALPEVLHLLADTSKSGELHVEGTRTQGRLWFDSGELTGFEVGRSDEAADAVFELLRIEGGDFSFTADCSRPESAHVAGGGHEDIRPVLDTAQARLAEWPEIVAVVPSLRHVVALAPHAPGDDVHLDASQWELVVAVGEGHSVGYVLDKRDLREYFGCKAVKALIDSSLVEVSEPVEVEPVDVDAAVVEEPVAEAEPEPVAHEDVLEAEAVVAATVSSDTYHQNGSVALPVVDAWDATPRPYESFEAGAQDGDAPVAETFAEVHSGARAEIEALLAEMAPADEADADHPATEEMYSATTDETPEADEAHEASKVDGLEDRGPWTSSELASLDHMGGWRDEDQPEVAAVFHPGSGYDADSAVADENEAEAGQPDGEAAFYEPATGHYDANGYDTNGYDANGYDANGAYEATSYEVQAEAPAEAEPEVEPEPEVPAEEPMNRGLLLKFLSSVRN